MNDELQVEAEETEEEIDPFDQPMTAERAVWSTLFDLRFRRRDWEDRPDPNGVLQHIDRLIAGLEEAQRNLKEYRKIKAALEVLRSV